MTTYSPPKLPNFTTASTPIPTPMPRPVMVPWPLGKPPPAQEPLPPPQPEMTVNGISNKSAVPDTPDWWPRFGPSTPNTPSGGSQNPATTSDWLGGVRETNASRLGTERPPGGVVGGKISPNGLYWINPDGTLVYMGSRENKDRNYNNGNTGGIIGDGFSGVRDGFLYAGGQRLMPTTGSSNEDQATLYQFGYRPQGGANAYQGWNTFDGLGVGTPTGGAQGRWMGDDPLSQFRSMNGWSQRYDDTQLREQLSYITQQDYDRYSPQMQRLIKQILGNTRPDLVFGNTNTSNSLADPLAAFRAWQAQQGNRP